MNQGSDPNLAALLAIEADIRTRNFKPAAAALDALALQAPADVRVHLTAAMLGRTAGNPLLEIESLLRAVAVAPRSWRVRVELAKALSRHGRHVRAVAVAAEAVDLGGDAMQGLEAAVAIADAAGDLPSAHRYLQKALALEPANPAILKSMGRNLAWQRRPAEAEPYLRAVLAVRPDDLLALGWLSSCLTELDRRSEALELLDRIRQLAPDDPSLPFHLALARGETPATQPDEIVRGVFDTYAHRFDAHLVGKLQYQVPQRIAAIVRRRSSGPAASVLDLGCGTGLVGRHLGRLGDGDFVGVDLSAKMLEKAAHTGVYTELRQGSLLDELRTSPAERFDYVVAADVFIYVGDVAQVVPACFGVLRRGGALIFSCETASAEEGAFVLRPSKRYAHSAESIESLCHESGFSRCALEPIALRLEDNVPVAGFIAVAEKP